MDIEVSTIAEALLSDKPAIPVLIRIVEQFAELFAGREPGSSAPIDLCRFAQEMAVYRQGAVVKKLVTNVLASQEEPSAEYDERMEQDCVALLSVRILTHLALSQVVAHSCIQDERSAWGLLDHYVENLECLRDPNREKAMWRRDSKLNQDLNDWSAFFSLAGMVYFSRASKLFRESMRENEELLPLLDFVLSDNYLARCSDVAAIRLRVSNLIEALSLSPDSKKWIVEQDYLRLAARIFETTNLAAQQDPEFQCAFYLFSLSEVPDCLALMRRKAVYTVFKLHHDVFETLEIGPIWSVLEDRLLGRVSRSKKSLQVEELRRQVELDMYASGLPTVCSWRGCSVPDQMVSGTKFSKCGRCHVAQYCSKDHQKLHWPQHKKHCFKAQAA